MRPRASSSDNWGVKSDQLTPDEGPTDGRTSALGLHDEYCYVALLFSKFSHKVCLIVIGPSCY